MKNRGNENWTREEWDKFLIKNYGYGIWEFENLFFLVFSLFDEKIDKKIIDHIKLRISQLERIKERTLESLDDLLRKSNFYKLNKEFQLTRIKKWTPEIRRKYLRKHFKLNPFFTVIDAKIEALKSKHEQMNNQGAKLTLFPVKVKPLNFLVIVLSHAMKRGQKVDWINMEILLNWFSRFLKKMDLLDFFGYKQGLSPSPEILRLTRNKYQKRKTYNFQTKMFFDLFFNIKKEEGKQKIPEPWDEFEDYIKWDYRDLEASKRFIDFVALITF